MGESLPAIAGAGSLGASLAQPAADGPLLQGIPPIAHAVLGPHMHWILWIVIGALLMSERPRAERLATPGWRTMLRAWCVPAAGALTFLLAGILGVVVVSRSPGHAFEVLLPACAGLFAVPPLILTSTRSERPCRQRGPSRMLRSPLTRVVIALMNGVPYHHMSAAALLFITALIAGIAGAYGLSILIVASSIGMIPVLYGASRLHGTGLILLPLACHVSGIEAPVAGWLGLM